MDKDPMSPVLVIVLDTLKSVTTTSFLNTSKVYSLLVVSELPEIEIQIAHTPPDDTVK